MDRMATVAGIRSIAITVAPTIATGEYGTMSVNSDDGNSHPNLGYQNLELPHLNGLRPWRCSLLLFPLRSFIGTASRRMHLSMLWVQNSG
jgi:hypothetical protein